MPSDDGPNAAQLAYWNGEQAEHWVRHEERYDAMLAPFTAHLLDAAAISASDRVLDIGCGCGATTRAAARGAPEGEALGIDLSEAMLQRGRARALGEGIPNARFEQGDAQVHRFADAGFDAAISRLGTMFFADPVAAFANVSRALRRGGTLALVCWQDMPSNEWLAVPGAAITAHVALPAVGDPGAPGPFSLADLSRLAGILGEAGFTDVRIDSVRETLTLGSDVDEAVGFLEHTGIGRALLEGADAATLERVVGEVRAALSRYEGRDGVRLGSAAWLATARR